MSINLDVVCVEQQISVPHGQERTVQIIGDILPFVLGKYGIDRSDCFLNATQELPQELKYSI